MNPTCCLSFIKYKYILRLYGCTLYYKNSKHVLIDVILNVIFFINIVIRIDFYCALYLVYNFEPYSRKYNCIQFFADFT